ncbi:MAG: 16S rRNA (cytosine(967)-C(5))-methyltransferase RsmB [Gammaproteobacteria bacterium]|nr:16S rRNA (cytosine(967)-C(5))-methyltransferase RsmB [Gammaproteobacteria bacterium]
MSGPTDARHQAVLTLVEILGDKKSLNYALPRHLNKLPAQQRALGKEIVFGVLRWLPKLQFQLTKLLQKPLKPKDTDIHCILLSGIYQLGYMSVGDHAAVNESVELTRKLDKVWASKLVNGVLRNFQRQREQLEQQAQQQPSAHWAHPAWFIEQIKAAWPEHWQAILDANNQHAPLWLRVNQQHQSREQYLQQLQQQGHVAHVAPFNQVGLRLEHAVDVSQLPGFENGDVSVQDAAAQLAADLLQAQAGDRVLDACAAPGGKTAHIVETQPQLAELVAIDNKPNRVALVADTLKRLNASATLITADASQPDQWWNKQPFQRILLDVPCSATGVIRRNPDIKFFRQAADIDSVVQEQQRILNNIWPLLAQGGQLVYATCSILPRENSQQIAQFLQQHPDAREIEIDAAWGQRCEHGRQILPGMNEMDGFYYAVLRKQ